MEVRISNSITSVAHIVRIWQGTALVSLHVCKVTGSYTEKVITLPTGTYDFEFVNPNLTDCKFRATPIWYNPNNGYATETFPIGSDTDVLAGQSYKITGVNTANYPNITLKVNAGQINSPSALYTLEGTDEVTTGNDSDGVTIPSGKGHYRKLKYKKIADSTFSSLQLENKKNWNTSDGVVDVSSYIPYLAVHNAVNSGLSAPIVNKTTMLNTDSLTVSGMQQSDIMHFFVNGDKSDNNTLVIDAGLQFIFPSMTGYEGTVYFNYTRAGVVSQNSEDVIVSTNPNKLGYLTFTSVTGQVNYYVGEQIDISDIASGATLNIGKGSTATATVEGTDYSITNITGGKRVTFLIAQIFQFWQTKPTFIAGGKTTVQVAAVRTVLARPIPSNTLIEVGSTVTITNQSTVGYSNINVLKANVLVIASEGDYSVTGGVYTFLKVGNYKFVGQKTDVADSLASDELVVSAVVLPPDIPPGTTRREYTGIVKNFAGVLPENVQFGSSYTTVDTVINWVDGLVLVLDISNNVRPNFFLRDKLNPTFTSKAFTAITEVIL